VLDSRALHPARPGHTAVGLGRRNYPNQGAFHRFDPDLAARADQSLRAFSHLLGPAQHPCRLPRAAPASSKVWWSLQTTPLATTRLSACRAAAEKMLLSDVCNRPTERAPLGGFDSRSRDLSPSGSCDPSDASPRNLGGASLDGDPPASASIAHRLTRSSGPEPRVNG
jgi:hypothetical protein